MIHIQTIASGSSGNCYRISDGLSSLIIEAGVRFETVQKAMRFQTRKVGGVLVTHEHGDHCKYTKQFLDHGLNVYMTKGTQEALGINHHRLFNIKYREMIRIGSFRVYPFDTQHDVNEPCGFIIASDNGGKLLFATDTYYIKYTVPGITHMMIEINHDYDIMMENVENGSIHKARAIRTMRSHMNLENAIKYLKGSDLSQLQEIQIIHISDQNAWGEMFKKEIQKVAGVPVKLAGRE